MVKVTISASSPEASAVVIRSSLEASGTQLKVILVLVYSSSSFLIVSVGGEAVCRMFSQVNSSGAFSSATAAFFSASLSPPHADSKVESTVTQASILTHLFFITLLL
ncbi:hypothetical protein D3C80_1722390 [compost metagenome]